MKRFKEQNKSRDPRQPWGWAAQPLVTHCAGRTPAWTGERQPEALKRTTSLWPAQHSLGRRFPPAPAPGKLGVSPGLLPVSPSCPPPTPPEIFPSSKHLHLLPGHGCPPPPASSDIPQLPREQEQQEPMLHGWMQHRGETWEDTHTEQGQKSHQIIGKQRACNNEKRTDFVTNHFFL